MIGVLTIGDCRVGESNELETFSSDFIFNCRHRFYHFRLFSKYRSTLSHEIVHPGSFNIIGPCLRITSVDGTNNIFSLGYVFAVLSVTPILEFFDDMFNKRIVSMVRMFHFTSPYLRGLSTAVATVASGTTLTPLSALLIAWIIAV